MAGKLTQLWESMYRNKYGQAAAITKIGVANQTTNRPQSAATSQPTAKPKKRKKGVSADVTVAAPPNEATSASHAHSSTVLSDITTTAANFTTTAPSSFSSASRSDSCPTAHMHDASIISHANARKRMREGDIDAVQHDDTRRAENGDDMSLTHSQAVHANNTIRPSGSSSVGVSVVVSSASIHDLGGLMRRFIRSQRDLYVRLLLFQPIDVAELAICMRAAGILDANVRNVRNLLDEEGICCTLRGEMKEENARASSMHFATFTREQSKPKRRKKGGAGYVPRGQWRRR